LTCKPGTEALNYASYQHVENDGGCFVPVFVPEHQPFISQSATPVRAVSGYAQIMGIPASWVHMSDLGNYVNLATFASSNGEGSSDQTRQNLRFPQLPD